ncbi:MAG: hypothetical protein Q9191_002894 [Dirinaria sp. TL-2023a]
MACGFTGNPDIYGIGIRIGYYSQALAVWFANYFHYREANAQRSVNNLFLFALTVVGLIYVHNARKTYAVEAFLLLYIAVVIAMVSLLQTRFTSRYMRISRDRMVIQSAIFHGGFIFAIFFWWKGLDEMRPTPCRRFVGNSTSPATQGAATHKGGTYACYLVRANMYGWMRTVMQVLSLWGLVWSVLVLGSSTPMDILHSLLRKQSQLDFVEAARSVAGGINANNQSAIAGVPAEPAKQSPTLTEPPLPKGSRVEESSSASEPNGDLPSTNGPPEERGKERKTSIMSPQQEQIMSAVLEAESYLNSLFTECQPPKALLGRKRVIILWRGFLRFYIPNRNPPADTRLVPLSKCLYTIFIWSTWGIIPMHLRWRLHVHLTGLAQGPLLIWPRILHRSYQFAEKTKPPDWRTVAIASDVQLHQIPLKMATRLWILSAIYNLLIIIILIVQVELTIVWNHIDGLNSLTSLGQLIAFILGVGGLLKVLWGKWRLVRLGIKDEMEAHRVPDEYEAALDIYTQWKAHQERQSTTQFHEQPEQTEQTEQARPSGSAPVEAVASIPTHAT